MISFERIKVWIFFEWNFNNTFSWISNLSFYLIKNRPRKNWLRKSLGKKYDAQYFIFGTCPHIYIFFFYLGFLSRTFTIHGTAGEGGGYLLTPLYHFHLLHRHLDISRAIAAGSSPLHIAGSRTRTGNLWFPSASR